MKASTRNDGLDVLKYLAAFLVVCVHVPFLSQFGAALSAVAHPKKKRLTPQRVSLF